MARHQDQHITEKFLNEHPEAVFVFGDNLLRFGKGGAAKLRDHSGSYGFITKKYPSNHYESFFKVEEYRPIFETELRFLVEEIKHSPEKTFYVSKLGGGLANHHRIWEEVIKDGLEKGLKKFPNVVFLWSS